MEVLESEGINVRIPIKEGVSQKREPSRLLLT